MVVRPHFTEQWFNPAKRRRLHAALDHIPSGAGQIIEVGSWEGRSTIEIANRVYPEPVQVIDHWKGDLSNLDNGVAAIAASRDVFQDFIENMQAATKGNYVVHRMDWRDYPWTETVKFIFIDGQHTYDEVADNIRAVLPLMVPRGVIAGDDITVPQVFRAVRDTLGVQGLDRVGGPGAAVWFWLKP